MVDGIEYVHAEAVRWVDREWPGWVEVQIPQSDGTVAVVVDKVPVLDLGDRLAPGVGFPVEIELPCDVLRWEVEDKSRRSAVLVLCHAIEDQVGSSTFRVSQGRIVTTGGRPCPVRQVVCSADPGMTVRRLSRRGVTLCSARDVRQKSAPLVEAQSDEP
jgi:hypothetical protein